MNTTDTILKTDSSFIKTDGKPVIEIKNLKKSFGEQEVLKDVSLKLFNGENLVVLGKMHYWFTERL
jgi:ABC-type transporter Mla maintaining outer membrane lipid asymmetry ATPase subunit MlaF